MTDEQYANVMYLLSGARGRVAGIRDASKLLADYGIHCEYEYARAVQGQFSTVDATLSDAMMALKDIYEDELAQGTED